MSTFDFDSPVENLNEPNLCSTFCHEWIFFTVFALPSFVAIRKHISDIDNTACVFSLSLKMMTYDGGIEDE